MACGGKFVREASLRVVLQHEMGRESILLNAVELCAGIDELRIEGATAALDDARHEEEKRDR
jgi:hypothetical protein